MRTLLAATLVGAGLTVVVATPASSVEVRTCATTPAAAHRGLTDHDIENSKGAVQAAIDAQAYFEVDLRETKDDRVVLMHDRRIDRTTNGTGPVASLTSKQIRRHRLDDGQAIPYAGAILRMVQDNPTAHAILEFKVLTPRTQRGLRDTINAYRIADRVEMISFDKSEIADFRRISPGVTTYLIAPDLPSLAVAERNGGVHVFPRLIRPQWSERMDARDIPFSGRIDDTPTGWDAAVEAGVTSVMTDTVAGYRQHCSSGATV